MTEITRRAVVAGGCGLACGLALTACAGYGEGRSAPAPATPAPGGTALAKTTDIPVGGGKVFADRDVVVTQPAAGTFKAFSATCTHQGCKVGEVAGGTINCPCHGSRFAVADGSVAKGPAAKPLDARTITVQGDSIALG
jgi:Rieske Fe-S protein